MRELSKVNSAKLPCIIYKVLFMHKSINFIFSCSRLYFIFYILLKEGWGKTVHLSDKAIDNLMVTQNNRVKSLPQRQLGIWVDDLDYPDWGNNRLDIKRANFHGSENFHNKLLWLKPRQRRSIHAWNLFMHECFIMWFYRKKVSIKLRIWTCTSQTSQKVQRRKELSEITF